VPHLIGVRQERPVSVLVQYPNVEPPVAATTWVGIAGVGYDAAEDTTPAEKRGVFGYDRVTKKGDVKDLSQTIVLLMVPSEGAGPWMAGGGSTVRGVADKDEDDKHPITPFLCMTYQSRSDRTKHLDGKKGTLAIMGDGKVRFIPETMSADLFRGLCTIASGKKTDKLDAEAPVVDPDSPVRELKSGGGSMTDKGKQPKEEIKAPQGWQVVKSKSGGFSVFMPAGKAPVVTNQVGTESNIVDSDKGRMALTVTHSEDLRQPATAEATMAEIIKGLGAKGRLGAQSKISFNGHAGKEFVVLATEGEQVLLKGRLYVIGPYLVTLMCSGNTSERDMNTFFGSLRQSEQPSGKDDTKKEEPKKTGPSNNKGKLEGTKWSSKAFEVAGPNNTKITLPAGACVVEFKADMKLTMVMKDQKGPETINGTYVLGPGDEVTLTPDKGQKVSEVLTVKIVVKGDEMTLTGLLGGQALEFARAR